MKKIMKTIAQVILATTLIFVACKKKEETNNTNSGTTSTTGTTTGTPVVVRTMTSTVNNLNWQANVDGYQKASTNSQFTFGGSTNPSNPNTLISFTLSPTFTLFETAPTEMKAMYCLLDSLTIIPL